MPELPEVETTVRGIKKNLIGKQIKDVWTNYGGAYHKGKDHIKDADNFKLFRKNSIGSKIVGAERRAKNVLINLSSGKTILVHMKMTGHLLYGKYSFDTKNKKDPWSAKEDGPLKDPFNRFIRFIIEFTDGSHLALSDMRRFAKVAMLNTNDKNPSAHISHLGPEPLDKSFDIKKFEERLSKKSNSPIKSVLMDQELIAGIGNIYSDEILWRAGVHPESKFSKIPKNNILLMFNAMKETLKKGIDFGGDSMSDYRNIKGEKGKFQEHHQAYRRTGLKCSKKGCGGTIIKKVIRGRSGHFCNKHQNFFN